MQAFDASVGFAMSGKEPQENAQNRLLASAYRPIHEEELGELGDIPYYNTDMMSQGGRLIELGLHFS